MNKGDIIHPGPVYICEKCKALINPKVHTQEVHVHGNRVVSKCNDFYCNNKVVTSRWYECPSCNKQIDLPSDPEAEDLIYEDKS